VTRLLTAGDLAKHLREAATSPRGGVADRELEGLPGGSRGRSEIMKPAAREQLLPLVERYAAAKAAARCLTTRSGRAGRPDREQAPGGGAPSARYQVILLDEYQDTSHAQLVLLASLLAAATRDRGR